jgi:hypothetical protein
MFESSWNEGIGSGPNAGSAYGHMPYSMVDTVKVPSTVGRYILSWRWDCEQTPQVSKAERQLSVNLLVGVLLSSIHVLFQFVFGLPLPMDAVRGEWRVADGNVSALFV